MHEGDSVKKGQLLLRIRPDNYLAMVSHAIGRRGHPARQCGPGPGPAAAANCQRQANRADLPPPGFAVQAKGYFPGRLRGGPGRLQCLAGGS
ncbi:MAG: hypothetical protein WKG07_04755 [Hymenobacter sp.]